MVGKSRRTKVGIVEAISLEFTLFGSADFTLVFDSLPVDRFRDVMPPELGHEKL